MSEAERRPGWRPRVAGRRDRRPPVGSGAQLARVFAAARARRRTLLLAIALFTGVVTALVVYGTLEAPRPLEPGLALGGLGVITTLVVALHVAGWSIPQDAAVRHLGQLELLGDLALLAAMLAGSIGWATLMPFQPVTVEQVIVVAMALLCVAFCLDMATVPERVNRLVADHRAERIRTAARYWLPEPSAAVTAGLLGRAGWRRTLASAAALGLATGAGCAVLALVAQVALQLAAPSWVPFLTVWLGLPISAACLMVTFAVGGLRAAGRRDRVTLLFLTLVAALVLVLLAAAAGAVGMSWALLPLVAMWVPALLVLTQVPRTVRRRWWPGPPVPWLAVHVARDLLRSAERLERTSEAAVGTRRRRGQLRGFWIEVTGGR